MWRMGTRGTMRWARRSVIVAGWLVSAANAHPAIDPVISQAQGMLAAAAAVAGTLSEVIVHVQRPVQDVWQSGRVYGRREAIREAERATVSLAARRKKRQARRDLSRLG